MMNHTGGRPYLHKYCNKVLTAFRGPHGIPNNPASYGLTSSPGVLDIDGLPEGGLNASSDYWILLRYWSFPCVNELFDFHMFIDLLGGCRIESLVTLVALI